MKVFEPPATTTSHINGMKARSFACMSGEVPYDGIQQKPVPSTIPEMFALHFDENIEGGLVILVIAMKYGIVRNINTLLILNIVTIFTLFIVIHSVLKYGR